MNKKTILSICIYLILTSFILNADAPDTEAEYIERVVKISNCNSVPEFMIIAYVEGSQLPVNGSYYAYEVKDNTAINMYYDYNDLTVFAVKRSIINNMGGLKNADIKRLISSGTVYNLNVIEPIDGFREAYGLTVYYEEIVYRISRVYNDEIFLEVREKTVNFTDGSTSHTIYTHNNDIKYLEETVTADKISASSYLDDRSLTYRYNPASIFDGNPETGWAEDADGPGINEYVEIELENSITIDELQIMAGWFQEEYFWKNNRVKKLEIKLDNYSFDAYFTDEMEIQEIRLNEPVTFSTARFKILEIYETTKWDDTCIAEIGFYLNNHEIAVDISDLYATKSVSVLEGFF